jgi:DNA-binding IclR family transcriptional regulator
MADKKIFVIEKMVQILDYIAEHNGSARLTDICNELNMVKSTAHGILLTMEGLDLIVKDKSTNLYALGIKLFRYGKIFEQNYSVKDLIHPYLEKLSAKYQECAHTGVPDGDCVLYVDMLETDHAVRLQARTGGRDPLYCTSIGKVILANMTEQEVEEYFDRMDIEQKTDNTITDLVEMKKALQVIRANRISYDIEELEKGLVCVASGIFNPEGELVAAIGISSPNGRVGMDTLEEMGNDIQKYCLEVEKLLK